jgi:hypothetical protein
MSYYKDAVFTVMIGQGFVILATTTKIMKMPSMNSTMLRETGERNLRLDAIKEVQRE